MYSQKRNYKSTSIALRYPSNPNFDRFSAPIPNQNHANNSTVILISNRIIFSTDIELPFSLSDTAILDRATSAEISEFKKAFSRHLPGGVECGALLHETEITYGINADGRQTRTSTTIPRTHWNYYVLRSNFGNSTMVDIDRMSGIFSIPLGASCFTLHQHGGCAWSPYRAIKAYEDFDFAGPKVLYKRDLEDLSKYLALGRESSKAFPEIDRALNIFDSLELLSPGSTLTVIGLFSIIEMLLTHKPKGDDDSISMQIRSKIPVVTERFPAPLPYNNFFDNCRPEKIWNALYTYRSEIAHGEYPDFSKKTLRLLRDGKNSEDFLRIATQAIIKLALHEPVLYRDLKAK